MKLDWYKVLTGYAWMGYGGMVSWAYCTWSMRYLWKGALVGAALFTVFLVTMTAIDFFSTLRKRGLWKKFLNKGWKSK